MDTGPAALLQIADSLRAYGLANGELGLLEDPDVKWSNKLQATVSCMNRVKEDVVFLCEEPGKWTAPPTADDAFSPYSNQHIQEVLAAIHDGLHCRRVFTATSRQRNDGYRSYFLPRGTHPSWLLDDSELWGADVRASCHELHARLGATLGVATPLEIRLLVALAEISSVTEVAAYYSSQWPNCQAISRTWHRELPRANVMPDSARSGATGTLSRTGGPGVAERVRCGIA